MRTLACTLLLLIVNHAQAWTVPELYQTLQASPTARKLLQTRPPKVRADSVRGSYTHGHTIHIPVGSRFSYALWAVAHELGHWEAQKQHLFQGSVWFQTQEQYVHTAILNEAYADHIRFSIFLELRGITPMHRPAGFLEWGQRPCLATCYWWLRSPAVHTSTTGKSYTEFYGDFWRQNCVWRKRR